MKYFYLSQFRYWNTKPNICFGSGAVKCFSGISNWFVPIYRPCRSRARRRSPLVTTIVISLCFYTKILHERIQSRKFWALCHTDIQQFYVPFNCWRYLKIKHQTTFLKYFQIFTCKVRIFLWDKKYFLKMKGIPQS